MEFNAALEKQGAKHDAAIERLSVALEKQGAEFNAALEKQGMEFNAALKEQGAEFRIALEKQSAALDRRLAANTYWMAGGMAATSLVLFGVVISLVT